MLRFLEFLGLVTVFFLVVYGAVFFLQDREDFDFDAGAQIEEEIVPAYQNLQLAEGQCSVLEMYSMSWCGYCRIKREQMQQQNIAFKEYILDEDRAAKRAFKRKMKSMKVRKYGYPTFIVNGEYTQNYPVDYLVNKSCS